MLAKISPVCWKILPVLFTSVVAPLGIRHLDAPSPEPPQAEVVPAVATEDAFKDRLPSTTRIVAKGTGPSAEAAFQNAVEAAIHQAVTAEISASEWRQHGPAYLASLRQNGTGVLCGWHEVSSSSERHLTGRVYHSEVAVEVDTLALRQHLQGVGPVTRH